jgi:hypothetical protein
MTLVACYVSSEGVVLGADSTTSYSPLVGAPIQHLNFAQKIFEVGPIGQGTLGLATWGTATVGQISHRIIVSQYSDSLQIAAVNSVDEAAARFSSFVWPHYSQQFAPHIATYRALDAKGIGRSPQEENAWQQLRQVLVVGYCLGGTWWKDRTPKAFEIIFQPSATGPPAPVVVPHAVLNFWGVRNVVHRIFHGIDEELLNKIASRWPGPQSELIALVSNYRLFPQGIPIPLREAIDFVDASIYATIKSLKFTFSSQAAMCGGPIEIATITSDRPFRWVKHKKMSDAIG